MKFVVVLFLSCLFTASLGFGAGLSSTVYNLPAFQTENGGFHSQKFDGAPGDIEETEHALFLASLFGVHQLNGEALKAFLDSLATSDNGFSHTPGQISELEAVRNALFSYSYLGARPSVDTSKLVAYVNSLYDPSTNLFQNSPGTSPDFKSTALALEVFQSINYNGADLLEKKAQINEKLKASFKYEEGYSFFSYLTSDNYYAILSASLVGFRFQEPASWIRYFSHRQVTVGAKKGGFLSDTYQRDATPDDLFFAVRSIYLIKGRALVTQNEINLQNMIGYLSTLPRGLEVAARGYAALASTVAFEEAFKIVPTYSVRDAKFRVTSKRIIQGTQFKPNLQIRTTYGVVHPALSVSLTIEHGDEYPDPIIFTFNPETMAYETEEYYDSANKLGPITFIYKIEWGVYGFDRLAFEVVEEKSIGYDLSVTSKAHYRGAEVPVGGSIGFGSTFNFDVKLGTVDIPQLKGGDFVVTFSVLDSSNVLIHSVPFDAKGNANLINFDFTLSNENLPAGRITFRIEVSNEEGVHTTEEISYNLSVRMVATQLELSSDKAVKFGETFTVSMVPATLSDNSLPKAYKSGERQFFMDLYTNSKTLLASYPGQLVSGADSKYVFSVNMQPRFDVVGTNYINFRYRDAHNNDIGLQNFDKELNDEPLELTVDASLEVTDLQGVPESGNLEYGNEVQFTFSVTDSKSGLPVFRGSSEGAVFLVLRHQAKDGTTFTSTRTRAYADAGATGQATNLAVNWIVDPNALKDKGQLVLVVQNGQGRETQLNYNGRPWAFDVTIGGPLSIRDTSYSHVFDQFDTTFLVSFELSCRDRPLNNADLTARVYHGNKGANIATLPVAAGLDGHYQVSWTSNTKKALAGDYVVQIYRRVDLERSTSSDKFEGAEPFFVITHYHEGNHASPLPFKTEFLVLLGLVVSSVLVSMKKVEIEKKANK